MRHFSGEFEAPPPLMADELDLIAGGEGEDTDDVQPPPQTEIVVTASGRGWDQPTWDLYLNYYTNINWTSPATGAGGGSGSGSGGEADVDQRACEAANLIRSQPNDQNVEYGYFIISDANGTRLSPMFTSNESDRIRFGGDDRLTLAEIGATSWDQVKGFVHNHPHTEDYGFIPGDPNQLNKMPSKADWAIADAIAGQSGGEASEFRLYIMDQSGTTRQYDVGDSRTKISTDLSGGNCQ